MPRVWGNNASVLRDDDEFTWVPFHQTDVTREFLESNGHKFFICGPKGIGKTLLLKMKSSEARKNQSGIDFLPANELVEKLNPVLHSMSSADIADLDVPTGWSRVWQLVLSVAIIKRLATSDHAQAAIKLPEKLLEVFPDPNDHSIAYHIDCILKIGAHNRRILIEEHSVPVRSLLREVHHGIHVFVDAIDDCVYSHVGHDLKNYVLEKKSQLGILSDRVWAAAQIGFVQAAVWLHETQRHIKIFGALRKEAFDYPELPDRQNLETYLLPLEYSQADLQGIFRTKLASLRKLDSRYFSDPTNPDEVVAFFGFTHLAHPSVKDQSGEPLRESVLDYIVRHSRGRPRELDQIGESLQFIESRPRSADEVRRKIRDKSKTWFEWAKSEMIPFWRDEYAAFLNEFNSNFIPKQEMERIVSKFREKHPSFEDPLLELFELGLVGCIVASENGVTQRFRQNDLDLPVGKQELLAATHYVIHPCVNLATRSAKQHYKPNLYNVAGHGYPFVSSENLLHVHFGAGALGIGLVVPLIADNKTVNICIVQRKGSATHADDKWKIFPQTGEMCDLSVQSRTGAHAVPERKTILRTVVVRDPLDEDVFSRYLRAWADGESAIFVLTDDQAKIGQLLRQATSVSLAVKSRKSMAAIAQLVVEHGSKVRAVYPFENDEEAIQEMGQILARANISMIKVSADRMCVNAKIDQLGMLVESEDYWRIVINDESSTSKRIWGGTSDGAFNHVVLFEDGPAEFELWREAKRLLVNGMHFAYVVYRFHAFSAHFGDSPDIVQRLIEEPLTGGAGFSQEMQDSLDRIGNLYIFYLLALAESKGLFRNRETLIELHDSLRAMYDGFGDRLVNMPDQLSRILRPSIDAVATKVERFRRPLDNLCKLIERSPLCNMYLHEGGLDIEHLDREVKAFKADCLGLIEYLHIGSRKASDH